MAEGGIGVFPQEPFQAHSENLLPVRPLVLWGYTNMDDERWNWGERLVRLAQRGVSSYQKIGAFVSAGWAAYINDGVMFLKRFPAIQATYPDFGCNFEMFTRHDMLELESLGPLTSIAPGAHVDHHEEWHLLQDVGDTDDEIIKKVEEITLLGRALD
jgi:hypothetical protein